MRFIESEFSIEQLEQFRDSEGFIDLTAAGIDFSSSHYSLSREIVGNESRVKNWVNFKGKKALIKGQPTDKEQDYGMYAELIVEEICKQLGIESAHYDLVKMKDENGNTVLGVLSESIVDLDKGEYLQSLRDIIGDQPGHETDYMTDHEFVVEQLREALANEEMEEDEVEKLIIEYMKRAAFGIAVLKEDEHTENISFIRRVVDGKKQIKLSPSFDSEASLMLLTDVETAKLYLDDIDLLESGARSVDPKIGVRRSEQEGGLDSVWMDTLDELCLEDDVYEYCLSVLSEPIDMDEIFERVEQRINAPLPEEVKLLAKYSYQCRNNEMQKVINCEMEVGYGGNTFNAQSLLGFLTGQGVKQEIRTGEQLDIGKKMQNDLATEQSVETEIDEEELE